MKTLEQIFHALFILYALYEFYYLLRFRWFCKIDLDYVSAVDDKEIKESDTLRRHEVRIFLFEGIPLLLSFPGLLTHSGLLFLFYLIFHYTSIWMSRRTWWRLVNKNNRGDFVYVLIRALCYVMIVLSYFVWGLNLSLWSLLKDALLYVGEFFW